MLSIYETCLTTFANWQQTSWHTVSTVSAVEAWSTGTRVELSQRNTATAVSTRTSRTDMNITVVNVDSVDRILSQLQQPVVNFYLQPVSTSAVSIVIGVLYRVVADWFASSSKGQGHSSMSKPKLGETYEKL